MRLVRVPRAGERRGAVVRPALCPGGAMAWEGGTGVHEGWEVPVQREPARPGTVFRISRARSTIRAHTGPDPPPVSRCRKDPEGRQCPELCAGEALSGLSMAGGDTVMNTTRLRGLAAPLGVAL